MIKIPQSYLSVRVNEEDKKEFEDFCNEVGMNVSVAINMFIKAVLKNNKLPFEVVGNTHFSKNLEEALEEAEKMRKHPEKYKSFSSVKELMEDLEKWKKNTIFNISINLSNKKSEIDEI